MQQKKYNFQTLMEGGTFAWIMIWLGLLHLFSEFSDWTPQI
jgi:hypothetical protein